MEAEDPGVFSRVPGEVGEDKRRGRGRRPQAFVITWFSLTARGPLSAVAHGSFDHVGVAIMVVGDPGHGLHCSMVVQPEIQRWSFAGLYITHPAGDLIALIVEALSTTKQS